jgi:hypothetical protein
MAVDMGLGLRGGSIEGRKDTCNDLRGATIIIRHTHLGLRQG